MSEINIKTILLKKSIIKKIKKKINFLLDDNNSKFYLLKKEYEKSSTFDNLIKLIKYYKNNTDELIKKINIKKLFYIINITFTNDKNKIIFFHKITNTYSGNIFTNLDNINNFNKEELNNLVYTLEKFKKSSSEYSYGLTILENKCKKWIKYYTPNNILYGRYTPGTAQISYNNIIDNVYTSDASITSFDNSDINSYIISLCGSGGNGTQPAYWNSDYKDTTGTGSGGSGAYISGIVPTSFSTGNNNYNIYSIDISFKDDSTKTEIKYVNSNNNDDMISLTLTADSGGSASGTSKYNCDGTIITDGKTGTGGAFSVINDNNIPFTNTILQNGEDGGKPNNKGTSNYTSSGSGVHTKNYSKEKQKNGFGACISYQYNYPKGPYKDPSKTYSMTLSGSQYSITSMGAGTSQLASGYGAGGTAAPANWEINGVNEASNMRKPTSGFCQVMGIYMS